MKPRTMSGPEIAGALFNAEWYRSQAPDVSLDDAVFHYLSTGWRYLLSPHPLFLPDYYLANCDLCLECQSEPVGHFLMTESGKLVSPHPEFDIGFYELQLRADDAISCNPLVHYLTEGWKKGLRPSRSFDPLWYTSRYSDIASAEIEPLTHYLMVGKREGRSAGPYSKRSVKGARHLNTADSFVEQGFNFENAEPRKATISIYIHLPEVDSCDHIASLIAKLTVPYVAYVMTNSAIKSEQAKVDFSRYGIFTNIHYLVTSDEDALLIPFVKSSRNLPDTDVCLKVTGYNPDARSALPEAAFKQIQDNLLGEPAQVDALLNAFRDNPNLGLVTSPYCSDLLQDPYMTREPGVLAPILDTLGAEIDKDGALDFAGGTMFWFRPNALSLMGLDTTAFRAQVRSHMRTDDYCNRSLEPLPPLACSLNGFQWTFAPRIYARYRLTDEDQVERVRNSGLFDETFYRATYLDVVAAGADPLRHWTLTGFKEGRDPSADFSTRYYIQSRRIAAAQINPIVHLLVSGAPHTDLSGKARQNHLSNVPTDVFGAYRNVHGSDIFASETFPIIRKGSVRALAFYLPQFHPFAENDRFWGKGFTEWTNTTKAQPMFEGHHQPRLPGELGFYDTRLKDTLVRQAELARRFGIEGFCLHHYFFSGKAVMRAPYDLILANPDIDIKFCLHWANEPWTVRFDGLSDHEGVLIEQSHEPDDDIAFFRDIEPALKDPRYIHIDGRPLLLIYRPSLFPDMKATLERWRQCCAKAGLPPLYCATVHTTFEGEIEPSVYGLDAAVEFPPHNTNVPNVIDRVRLYDSRLPAGVYDYSSVVNQSLSKSLPDYTLFRGAMLEWDCTARRAAFGAYINYSPYRYEKWLTALCTQTNKSQRPEEQLVFINAWNEWAEGTYLEPDRRFGYATLQATANALNAYTREPEAQRKEQRVLVIMHVFYKDLATEMLEYANRMPQSFDLLITAPRSYVETLRTLIAEFDLSRCEKVTVIAVDNFGFDIAPFVIQALPIALDYDVCCKIHSKRTPYNSKFKGWRRYLFDNILGSAGNISAILETFSDQPEVGLIYPHPYDPVRKHLEWGSNYQYATRLANSLKITLDQAKPLSFPAGSMFWFRPAALKTLLQLDLAASDFGPARRTAVPFKESFVIDGSVAHAIERMFDLVSDAAGFRSLRYSFWNKDPGADAESLDGANQTPNSLTSAGW